MNSNKKMIAVSLAIIVLISLFWGFNQFARNKKSATATNAEAKQATYYTCPMHPQIHQDHPGECPICHMKLVKLAKATGQGSQDDKRSIVHATQSQLELLGTQKQEVEKMNLTATIPVSGRIISSSSVAFQVYEKDLKHIRSGLRFKGESSTDSSDEISGIISSVDSIIDPTSRTVRVLGNIQKGPGKLISETSFRGVIKIELKDVVAIAESSVLHTGQGDLVYLVDGENKLTQKIVKLGLKAEGFYEVLSGLNPGEMISSGPNFLIDSEAKIRGANE